MPRGQLEPMWLLSVGSTLPIFTGRKQGKAVAESARREEAEAQGAEAVRQLLRLRVQERLTVLESLLQTNALYRDGLLVQSRATSESTVRQYEVGRVTFASVLEALGGYVSDRANHLDSMAQALRIAIAQAELSLEGTPALGGALGAGAVPGAAAMGPTGGGSGSGGGGSPAAAGGSPAGGGPGMSKM
jgi:outer membrane protein TolC